MVIAPEAGNRDGALARDDESGRRDRRPPVLVGLVVLLAAVIGVAVMAGRSDEAPAPRPDIPLDTWAPYWTLDDSLPELERRAGSMREISPFWYNATGVESIEVDPNADLDATAEFLAIARSSGARVVPSIVDALPAGGMAAILADPETRSRHVDALVEFAAAGDFDGLDLDYEQFAFADGRATWATTRPNWVAFVERLADELHADGRTLTVSIPPVFDAGRDAGSGFWVYDYGAIAPHVDRIRIMAYDFSVTAPGPISPLAWVESAITGAIEATGSADKLVLGVPAYGRNWPTATAGECPADDVPGRTTVTARTVEDLVARRGATPVFDAEVGEWSFGYELELADSASSCVQTRQVHYVDGDGVRLRMDLARQYRLDGVSLWALGFDDDDVWNAILPTVGDPAATLTPD